MARAPSAPLAWCRTSSKKGWVQSTPSLPGGRSPPAGLWCACERWQRRRRQRRGVAAGIGAAWGGSARACDSCGVALAAAAAATALSALVWAGGCGLLLYWCGCPPFVAGGAWFLRRCCWGTTPAQCSFYQCSFYLQTLPGVNHHLVSTRLCNSQHYCPAAALGFPAPTMRRPCA